MSSATDSAVFRMENVTKRFGGLYALTKINLSVNQNQIIGLIGPNGAGKSTLFNVVTSIYNPDGGDIFLKDEKITGKSPHHICWMGISRTFQLAQTFLSMTALENVLVSAIYGRKERNKKPTKGSN